MITAQNGKGSKPRAGRNNPAYREGWERIYGKKKPPCPKCGGKGWYSYDDNHGRPCEACCPHDQGWWELSENHAGYIAGGDNQCCRGCGQLHRELNQEEKS